MLCSSSFVSLLVFALGTHSHNIFNLVKLTLNVVYMRAREGSRNAYGRKEERDKRRGSQGMGGREGMILYLFLPYYKCIKTEIQ